MDILLWVLVIGLFSLSFIGLIIPIIPSSIALWIGFIIYHFFINDLELTLSFWILMIIFTIVLTVADIFSNKYFVNRFGGSKKGEYTAMLALIIGAFVWPPFGIVIVPFIAVFIVELIQEKTLKEAFYASLGSLIGFVSGTAIKVIIQILMVLTFSVYIIF